MTDKEQEKGQLREIYANELGGLGMDMKDAANLAALSSGRHWEAQKKVLWNMKNACVLKAFGDVPLTHEQYITTYAEFRSMSHFETLVEEFAEGFNQFIKQMNLVDNDQSED